MSNWPVVNAAEPLFIGSNSPDGVSVVLTSPASTTASPWVQITAATPTLASALHVIVRAPWSRRILIEFAIGAAGSEVIIGAVPIVSQGVSNGTETDPTQYHAPFVLPVNIPAAVRLSARVTCATTVACTFNVTTHLQPASALAPLGFTRCSVHGMDSNLYLSTVIANASLYGAWVELVNAAPFHVRAYMLLANVGDSIASHSAGGRAEMQVGVGASGSESARYSRANGVRWTDWQPIIYSPLVFANYPAGTRFAVRCRVDSGNRWENSAGLILFG